MFNITLHRKGLGYQSDLDNPVKIGGLSFINRFGYSLNAHPHFHCDIIEGVFVKNSDTQITFHKLSSLTEQGIQVLQKRVRLRVLKKFKRSGLLESHDVENMCFLVKIIDNYFDHTEIFQICG